MGGVAFLTKRECVQAHREAWRDVVAEGDELELAGAPRKTPGLFETYLPFALALGVSQAWSEKFATVFLTQAAAGYTPDWYHGDRFDANDRPFVLLDSGMTELSAIAPTPDGAVYAAAIARGDASPSAGESTAIAVTTASTTPSAAATTTPPPAPPRRGTVFRIEASGVWEEIWESPDVVYDLATAAEYFDLIILLKQRLYAFGPPEAVLHPELLSEVYEGKLKAFADLERNSSPAARATKRSHKRCRSRPARSVRTSATSFSSWKCSHGAS